MVSANAGTLSTKVRGVIRLTRWKEYVLFVVPVTVFGALLATKAHNTTPNWHLILAILANTLAVAYAFMINDIEDAPDDAREAHRAVRNPVACGELTPREGWVASLLVAAVTLALFALLGTRAFAIGALTLALSHFYSWKPVRLKAWPLTDVVSHSLMLSGLLFLAGYFVYDTQPGPVWLVALSVTLLSSYGQLYNQIRDYEMDKAAKLRNTAIVIGKRNTQILMYGAVLVALALMLYALYAQVVPLWIAAVPLVLAPIFYFVRLKGDARGGVAADFSGNVQVQFLILANCTVGVWFIARVLGIA